MAYSQTLDNNTVLEKFSKNAKQVIVSAYESAKDVGMTTLTPKHLFIGILKSENNLASRLLNQLGVDIEKTLSALVGNKVKTENVQNGVEMKLSETSKTVLVEAYIIASQLKHVYVGTEHIMLSILKQNREDFVSELKDVGLTYDMVLKSLTNFATYPPGVFRTKEEGEGEPGSEEEQGPSALSFFAQDMNELAEAGKYMPIYGRVKELERLIHILSRKTKSNPILVGEAGVGKTAIVEGLAQRISTGEVPGSFMEKRIVNLDIAGILAGSKIRGDIEERIISIINEAIDDPNIILFIDEIHMIIGAGTGGQGSMDIANILKPYLTTGEISVIGSTTFNEYQKYFESDSALSRRFQPIFVDEINEDEAIKVLENIKVKLEDFHNVNISQEAIEESVRLSNRYIVDRFLPDKAIDVIDETAAGKKIVKEKSGKNSKYSLLMDHYREIKKKKNDAIMENKMQIASDYRHIEMDLEQQIGKMKKKDKTAKRYIVDREDVRRVVAKLTKIPVEKIDTNTMKALKNLKQTLEKRIVGQPDAVERVSAALKRARVGIGDAHRPLASFMFLGPTGVGKTELAKVVADELFGDEEALIQIDMSEYMEQHSVSKLIGSPPGYIGFQEGGQLTEKIRRRPYSVVLFDEIEKAHPDLLNILLQILEDGRLQDSKGRLINFKNTIIIMTSNIGADEVGQDKVLGFNVDANETNDPDSKELDKAFTEMREVLLQTLKDTLRPELLNRIDDVVIYRGLDDTDILKITKLEIVKLNKRLEKKCVELDVSRSVVEYIAEEGFDEEYGARNIRRKVQELLENPLAELLIEKNIVDNAEKVVIKVVKKADKIELSIK